MAIKQHIDDSPGSFKSGGRHIEDHSFWAGKPGKDSVFPDGPHKTKEESSAEGAGAVSRYEDTTERIREAQMMGDGKIKGRPMKPGYRY